MVLAGGRSSRMGADKALLKINELTLLEIVVLNLMKAGIDSIHVLVKDRKQADAYRNILDNRVSFHLDPLDTKGPWEALVAMLQQLDEMEIVQLLPVDTPWFDHVAIGLLRRQMERLPELEGVLPMDEYGSHPLLAQFRSGIMLQHLLSQPPQSLRSLFEQVNLKAILAEDFHYAGCHPNCFLNLNYPEDFSK